MPELPEVEVVRRGLAPELVGQIVQSCTLARADLRWPMPSDLPQLLRDKKLLKLSRRGKYLLFHFEHGMMLVHLGMSGTLRFVPINSPPLIHDHVEWIIGRKCLRLNDPRRFGAVLWTQQFEHPLLMNLGIEPFDETFTPAYFYQSLQACRGPIKTVLLAGKIVVGVGNIYASEALFCAGIHPARAANRISATRVATLHRAIVLTLEKAIEAGGSSIRDFLNVNGTQGYFQQKYVVYGRSGEPCRACATPIRKLVQGQRTTFYCPTCQR